MYVRVSYMIANHVRKYYISTIPTCRTNMKINGDETTHWITALGTGSTPDRNTPTLLRIRRGSLTFTICRTTNPAADAGSAWDLRHHTTPTHAPNVTEPVPIDPSGDPILKFHTRSMIHPDLESHPRPESASELGARRGHRFRTRHQIPPRSLTNSGCSIPHSLHDPNPVEGCTTIPNLAHVADRHRTSHPVPGTVYDTATEYMVPPKSRSLVGST